MLRDGAREFALRTRDVAPLHVLTKLRLNLGEFPVMEILGSRVVVLRHRSDNIPAQWWNKRMPVTAMAMPYLSQHSITRSSRMDPPGSAI